MPLSPPLTDTTGHGAGGEEEFVAACGTKRDVLVVALGLAEMCMTTGDVVVAAELAAHQGVLMLDAGELACRGEAVLARLRPRLEAAVGDARLHLASDPRALHPGLGDGIREASPGVLAEVGLAALVVGAGAARS